MPSGPSPFVVLGWQFLGVGRGGGGGGRGSWEPSSWPAETLRMDTKTGLWIYLIFIVLNLFLCLTEF